jgi:hypothetical protein
MDVLLDIKSELATDSNSRDVCHEHVTVCEFTCHVSVTMAKLLKGISFAVLVVIDIHHSIRAQSKLSHAGIVPLKQSMNCYCRNYSDSL